MHENKKETTNSTNERISVRDVVSFVFGTAKSKQTAIFPTERDFRAI
jgi:hypothetical protein